MSNRIEELQQKADAQIRDKVALWDRVEARSAQYHSLLELSDAQLSVLEHDGPYPLLEIEGYTLSVTHVCGASYGSHWQDLIMARRWIGDDPRYRKVDETTSETTGGGTTEIWALMPKHHDRLIEALQREKGEKP